MPLALASLLFILNKSKNLITNASAFSFCYFFSNLTWIYYSLNGVVGINPIASILLMALFSAYLSIFSVSAIAVSFAFFKERTLSLPALWTISEIIRSKIFTGFDWMSVGYSQIPEYPSNSKNIFLSLMPLAGIYSISFITVLIATLISSKKFKNVYIILPILIISLHYRKYEWTTPTQRLSYSIIQGNIPQSLKFDPTVRDEANRFYYKSILDEKSDLIILPETSFIGVYDPLIYSDLKNKLRLNRQDAIIGIFYVQGTFPDVKYYNSAILLPDDTQKYNKRHLVPFGEYTPRIFSWTTQLLNIQMSNLSPGEYKNLQIQNNINISVNICYENGFNDELIASARDSNLMINISNLAWFGNSSAQFQHSQISQARAMEFSRPTLSATNTGISSYIDQNGDLIQTLKPFTRDILRGEVQTVTGQTPFSKFGNFSIITICLLVIGLAKTNYKKHSQK